MDSPLPSTQLPPLFAEKSAELLAEFVAAHHRELSPSLEEFLARLPEGGETFLLALVLADLQEQWQRDTPIRVEDYLRRFPTLSTQIPNLVEAEYLARRQVQEEVTLSEYLERFPEERAEIAQRLGRIISEDETQTPQSPRTPSDDEPPVIPGCQMLPARLLGKGGMAVVWCGRETALGRPVAVKVAQWRFRDQKPILDRFIREARITSQLAHPSIPPIHRLGELPDGRPFFCMKVIRGQTLDEKLKARKNPGQDLADFLGIFAQVCQALAFAHSKGVIHRDLKPSNVMVGVFGEVQVMDWGLAKVGDRENDAPLPADSAATSESSIALASDPLTRAGDVFGTLPYMPPEQAKGLMHQVDARSDVFSLGAILCEILTGYPPYRGTRMEVQDQANMGNLQEAQERLAACGAEAVLVHLTGLCLQPVPGQRPSGAEEVALTIRDHLVSVQERVRLAELAAAQRAVEIEKQAKAEVECLKDQVDGLVYSSNISLVLSAWKEGDVQLAREYRDRCEGKRRGWEHRYIHTLLDHSMVTLKGHTSFVLSVAFSPDGSRIASASVDQTVKVWDAWIGQETLTLKGHTRRVTSVVFSPDGRRIASASEDLSVKMWDAWTGQETLTLKGHTSYVNSVAFSPDDSRIASASADMTVKVWDARTGQVTLTLKGHTDYVTSVVFSPDGRHIASSSRDKTVKKWDALTGQVILTLRGHTNAISSVVFSPDGSRIASASSDQTVKVWDAQSGQVSLTLIGHSDTVNSVVFSPDGTRIASASRDQTIIMWDARTSQETLTLKGHTDYVTSVVFSPDGCRIASASSDQTVKVWDAQSGQGPLTLRGHSDIVNFVVFSPDGIRIASASRDKTVKVWDAWTGQEILTLKGHTRWVTSVVFGPDGIRIASASGDQTVKVWDARTGQETLTLKGHTSYVNSVGFSPDGSRIASASGILFGSTSGVVKVWDARTGQETLTLKGHTDYVTSVVFSPDGSRIASASEDHTVKVWDARTGQETLTLKGHTSTVSYVSFSPDGSCITTASADQTVKVWDARTGLETLTLKGHTSAVSSVVICSDGSRITSASFDKTLKVWDARTGQETLTLKGHPFAATSAVFSPDRSHIASASADMTVKVWDARTRQETFTLKGHAHQVRSVVFSPDGTHIASASEDKTVKVWDVRTGQETLTLKGHTETVNSLAFSPDGSKIVSQDLRGKILSWNITDGQLLPISEPFLPLKGSPNISPDGHWIARIEGDRIRVGPVHPRRDDAILTRLNDPWYRLGFHRERLAEALQAKDSFAIGFHLPHVARLSFAAPAARPRDLFPLWAQRPGLQLASGEDRLGINEAHLPLLETEFACETEGKETWDAWAILGWCRFLRRDFVTAENALHKAIALHPVEPMLWAVLGTIQLHAGFLLKAETTRAKLASWPGIAVAAWHVAEAQACTEEGRLKEAAWHQKYLRL